MRGFGHESPLVPKWTQVRFETFVEETAGDPLRAANQRPKPSTEPKTTDSAESTLGFHATPSFAIEGPRTDGLELLGTPESTEQFEEAIARAG
jgi:hypothetical protein